MNLKLISDQDLLLSAQETVKRERELTGLVLEHLREIECRRLFAKLGFGSLFEYCVEELKYCAAAAQLRIDAMRLAKELQQVKEALNAGSVTLSSVGTLQKFIRNEKRQLGKVYNPREKAELFRQIENKSKAETETLLRAISPQALPLEKERVLSATETEIRFVDDSELQALLVEIREKVGDPGIGTADLLKRVLKKALGKPAQKAKPQKLSNGEPDKTQTTSPGEVTERKKSRREHIPKALLQKLRADSNDQCTFVSQLTGRRCTQRHGVQVEHCVPWAKGGSSRAENLTLLCPAHNRLRAIEEFGEIKLAPYLVPSGQ